MRLEKRDDGKYAFELYESGSAYVLTQDQVEELARLCEQHNGDLMTVKLELDAALAKLATVTRARDELLSKNNLSWTVSVMGVEKVQKQRTFLVADDALGTWAITGNLEATLAYIRSYLDELNEGEEYELSVQRRDMTQEEIDAIPVQ